MDRIETAILAAVYAPLSVFASIAVFVCSSSLVAWFIALIPTFGVALLCVVLWLKLREWLSK